MKGSCKFDEEGGSNRLKQVKKKKIADQDV